MIVASRDCHPRIFFFRTGYLYQRVGEPAPGMVCAHDQRAGGAKEAFVMRPDQLVQMNYVDQ